MPKCKKCGKKGLFLKLNEDGLCEECAERAFQVACGLMERAEAEYQEELLYDACMAVEEYEKDGDIAKAIAALEEVIIEPGPAILNYEPLLDQKYTRFLFDLYKKSGQNDKAWELLNECVPDAVCYGGRTRMPIRDVRLEMAKMLESEKKYSDAIEMYMRSYFYDASVIAPIFPDDVEEPFREIIQPCLSELKWNDDIVSDLVEIILRNIKEEIPVRGEMIVAGEYDKYLEEHHLKEA